VDDSLTNIKATVPPRQYSAQLCCDQILTTEGRLKSKYSAWCGDGEKGRSFLFSIIFHHLHYIQVALLANHLVVTGEKFRILSGEESAFCRHGSLKNSHTTYPAIMDRNIHPPTVRKRSIDIDLVIFTTLLSFPLSKERADCTLYHHYPQLPHIFIYIQTKVTVATMVKSFYGRSSYITTKS